MNHLIDFAKRHHDMSDMDGMSMNTTSSSDSAMDSMSHMSMNMFLTTHYKDYPVLFKNLSAANAGQAFGIFLLFFVVSFLAKGFEFAKNYLEQKVWKNPSYQVGQSTTIVEQCGCDEEDIKVTSDASEPVTASGSHPQLPLFTVLYRDLVRILLCFLSELFSYAMMLVAMSYALVYFFAVVLGMAFGRFFFERLSDRIGVRPGGNNFQGHH